MIRISTVRRNRALITNKIASFYINIWIDRMSGLTLRKYNFRQARANVLSAISFFGQTFDDHQLRKPRISAWQKEGIYEIYYRKWHFAVVVQYDIFGNAVAIVQDCRHDKDYHDDTMETKPFVMDNPNDKSHLVDWNERRLKSIVENVIRSYLTQNLLRS